MSSTSSYFVRVDGSGNLIGFYTPDVGPVPSDAIPISYALYTQWQQGFLANPTQYYKLDLTSRTALIAYTPAPAAVTPQMNFAAAMTAGLAVTSTGNAIAPTTFALTPDQQSNLGNVAIYIQKNSRFPASQTTLPLYATSGALVQIPSTTVWDDIATAAADYVTLCTLAMQVQAGGGSWVAPSNSATIA